MSMFVVSGSPHVHGTNSTRRIMLDVLVALFPATLVAFVVFGLGALKVVTLSIISCVFAEWFIQKFLIKGESTLGDLSAIVTGLLLGLNLPSTLPWYTIILGSFFAIGVAKMAFGGLGNNIFNPALVGRVFLLISFPAQMTIFAKPLETSKMFFLNGFRGMSQTAVDAVTSATPLSALAEGGISAVSPNYFDYFIGVMGGSLGEISALALLVGGIYLLIRKVINWRIPVIYILTVFVFTGILWLINPTQFANPLFHILTGGLMLGAIFMATDMVTSPMTKAGMVVFALGCGILTVIIRVFGSYPEGVSFAILIMNAFVPLINRGFRPKMYGKEKIK
jgi:electron transport complex protein RnfD